VDLILHQLGAVFKADVPAGQTPALVYSIQKSEDPTFFPGRRADVLLNGFATLLHAPLLSFYVFSVFFF
jgi:phenylalanyl-tRNA synthetase beta subunit